MIQLGRRLELFVDHFLIDRMDGARLRLHHPVPREAVLRFDKPWEGPFCGYPTVFQDGEICRLYYRGWPSAEKDSPAFYCYAESRDGIRWQRPALGLHEFQGSRDNNIILTGDGTHAFSPFIDARPGVPAGQRYKALGNARRGQTRGLLAFASADGVRFSLMQDELVMTKGAFDSQNLAFWSQSELCYVAYYRVFSESKDWGEFKGKRTIARAVSDDFLHWSDPVRMDFGDTPTEHLYTNQTLPYFRAPHIYIALPKRFVPDRRTLSDEQVEQFQLEPRQATAVSEGVFMTSRGGNRYDRTFMEGFFRPGLDQANWSARNCLSAWGVVQTGEAEMSLYYQQHYAQPTAFLLRTTLRLDGFSSVSAGCAGGEMLTRPFTFEGSRLALNVSTSAAGSVRVEVRDEGGRPLPGLALDDCDEIWGDQIERVVSWRGNSDVAALADRGVRLRFALKDADLYALRFS